MMRANRLYPFLFAAIPVLTIVSGNPGESSLLDLVQVLGAVLLIAALIYLAARYLLPRPAGERLAPLVTLLAMAGLLAYRSVAMMVADGASRQAELLLAPVALAAAAALVVWALRRPRSHERLATFLTLMSGMLVAFGVADIANDRRRSAERLRESPYLASLARPIPGPAAPRGPARDVYVLILDQYANERVLREQYGYDNRPFLDSLRALGFYIPPTTRSNYGHTMLSIPSLLNAAHLAPMARELGRRDSDPTLANYLVGHSRVASYLQARGYRYVFFPSQWWYATRETPRADVEPQVWGRLSPRRALGRTELRRAVLTASVVPGRLVNTKEEDADYVRRTLRGVALAHRFGHPVYVVAHIISPHPPYTVDADCKSPPSRPSYRGQIECLNHRLLALVNELLEASAVPPIIILQGDHGTKSLGFNDHPTPAQVPPAAARERFGALGAYYLPDGGRSEFGDTVTVVNVMGNVLRHYFGAQLPREPDAYYVSVEHDPFNFRRVDPTWLAPPRIGVRSAGARVSAAAR
jgi:hypothetical protein